MRATHKHHAFQIAVLVAAVGTLALAPALNAVAATATAAARTSVGDASGGKSAFYLALGDSVAAGFQPGRGETSNGYVDDLWRSIGQQIPNLNLRNVSCPGETSGSLITGKKSPCRYEAGSQLNRATNFLDAHPDEIAFITIDIGANDILNRCMRWRMGLFDKACANDQLPRLQNRLTHIVKALNAAEPGVPIVAMNYYNPFLGTWGLVPGGRALARANQDVWAKRNAGLTSAYKDAGATVADVAATFRIDDFKHTVVVPDRGRLPVNVALACEWTWFCSKRHFGDPHPNRTGYQKIARTFERELQCLLRRR